MSEGKTVVYVDGSVDTLDELCGRRDRYRAELETHLAQQRVLRQEFRAVKAELTALSSEDGHPDRWFGQNGQRFVDALAARIQLEQEPALAATPESVFAARRELAAYRRLLGGELYPVEREAERIRGLESLWEREPGDLETCGPR